MANWETSNLRRIQQASLYEFDFVWFLGLPLARPYTRPILSVRLSVVTRVICDHTVQPIEKILVLLESPKFLVSEKVSLVQIGHF